MHDHTQKICYKLIGYPEDWKFKKRSPNLNNERNFNTASRGKGIANNVHVDNNNEELRNDTFGPVDTEQHSSLSDFNSIRANLHAFAAQPNFTPIQYQKILQLINQEEKIEGISNMVGNFNNIVAISSHAARKDDYADALNSKKGNWIVDSGATCHMTSTLKKLDNVHMSNKNIGRRVYLPNSHTTLATDYEACDNEIVVVTPNYVANHDDSAIGDGNVLNGSDTVHIDDVVNGSDADVEDLEAVPAETQEIDEVPEASLHPDTESIVLPKTSSRISHPPIWMKEYVTHVTDSDHPHSLANYVSYSKLSPTYQVYLSNMFNYTEPRTYEEAVKDPR
ncbi:hypothetical protein KY289_007804 [Solanum tuberosum]|nr:hypothetical protein KY289_007804 [Solanum tuberosum]